MQNVFFCLFAMSLVLSGNVSVSAQSYDDSRFNSFSNSLSSMSARMRESYNMAAYRRAQWEAIAYPHSELSDQYYAGAVSRNQQNGQGQGLPSNGLGQSLNNNPFFMKGLGMGSSGMSSSGMGSSGMSGYGQ